MVLTQLIGRSEMNEISGFDLTELISITADLMAILGIGGLFTWSLVKKDQQTQSIEDVGIGVFAMSVKLGALRGH